jgi:hypothetical protein
MGTGKREKIRAEWERPARLFVARHGRERLERFGISVYEIKDSVLRRFEASNKGRPCDRALGRIGCPKPGEAAFSLKSGEIREITPVALDKPRVHAVDAKDDEAPRRPFGAEVSTATKRPIYKDA